MMKCADMLYHEIDKHCIEISTQQATIEEDIHATFRKLREILNDRETELINQLNRIACGA